MFLAPLNYDRFFKKVFSDLNIAKAFIEDFLEVKIESIEALDITKKFTDKAAIVEFDYRCMIDGRYIIIDMQQWFKPDVTQRFFLYHALNTGLQLEKLPEKKLIIEKDTGKTKIIKDYRRVEPVSTFVWMVDDTLGFDDNYISYKLYPHTIEQFLKDNKLWKQEEIKNLLKERTKVLVNLENKKKNIDFLSKNSLVFMFQKNIIKDQKMDKYRRWFHFAEKTRNENNKEEDFIEYRGDVIFEEIIHRINTSKLKENDVSYINDEKELIEEISRWEYGKIEEGRAEGVEQGRAEGVEQGRAEGVEQAKLEMAMNLLNSDIEIDIISKATKLSKEKILKLKKNC